MPLPPALAARLAKRGLIQTSTSASVRNKENSSDSASVRKCSIIGIHLSTIT